MGSIDCGESLSLWAFYRPKCRYEAGEHRSETGLPEEFVGNCVAKPGHHLSLLLLEKKIHFLRADHRWWRGSPPRQTLAWRISRLNASKPCFCLFVCARVRADIFNRKIETHLLFCRKPHKTCMQQHSSSYWCLL